MVLSMFYVHDNNRLINLSITQHFHVISVFSLCELNAYSTEIIQIMLAVKYESGGNIIVSWI